MIRKTTDKSRGIRLGNFVQIRTIVDEELEQVWSGKKTRQGSAGRDRQARQRAAGALREGQQELTAGDCAGAERDHGRRKARPLPIGAGCPGCCSRRSWRSSLVFFFWPAGQALLQSVLQQDAFGTSTEFVGLENFARLFDDETYLASFKTTAVFSVLVAGAGAVASSLLLAVLADRVVRGAAIYKTLLIWPYAVAPAVAGVLWLFMFAPSSASSRYCAARARASTGTTCSTATTRWR